MPLVNTQIQIAASSAEVRAKFLEFSSVPTYTPDGFIRSIASSTDKPSTELTKGDIMNCVVGGGSMKIKPVVLENSEKAFIWRGSLPYIFTGDHAFRFEDVSTGSEAATLFVHEENFSGLLSFIMGENWVADLIGMRKDTQKGFAGFNEDFKKWVEGK